MVKHRYNIGDVVNGKTITGFTSDKHGRVYSYMCHCGKSSKTNSSNIRKHKGCKNCVDTGSHRTLESLIGTKINHVELIGILPASKFRKRVLILRCDCGKIWNRPAGSFKKLTSCGCKRIYHKGDNCATTHIPDIDMASIRELGKTKLYTIKEISQMYNITHSYCHKIIKNHVRKSE
jgi:hypothetical protein